MKKLGYTTGVFDLFHIGHLNLLQRAKSCCDYLIVGVTTDELAFERKNKLPIIPFSERVQIVRSLNCVDAVVPQKAMDKVNAWKNLQFHMMFVGDDWKGTPYWVTLEETFKRLGVEIKYFPYTKHTSSTLIRKIVESFDTEE